MTSIILPGGGDREEGRATTASPPYQSPVASELPLLNAEMKKATIVGGPPSKCATAEKDHRGYSDARLSAPWPKEYETWPRGAQLNYEMGRHRFAAMSRVLGHAAPSWPQNIRLATHLRRHLSAEQERAWRNDVAIGYYEHGHKDRAQSAAPQTPSPK